MPDNLECRSGGFSLIEMLVVVLIVGILAAVVTPQYTKVVERGRVHEAVNFIGEIRAAQARYFGRTDNYVTGTLSNLTNLDITFNGDATVIGGTNFGLKTFRIVGIIAGIGCPSGGKHYRIRLRRCSTTPCPRVAAKYQGYRVQYDTCSDSYSVISCAGGTSACDEIAP